MARKKLKPADAVGWNRDDRKLTVIADLGEWVVAIVPPLADDDDGSPRTVMAVEASELTFQA